MPNKPRGGSSVVTFTLEDELLERASYMAEQLEKEHPGLRFSRFDAIRSILAKNLPALPKEWTPTGKASATTDREAVPRAAKRAKNAKPKA
jgi:hypothetical protein